MGSTYCEVLLHLVFSTKNRRPWVAQPVRSRLYAFMAGIVKDEKGRCLQIGGTEDHVHMLVRWRTDASIADLMRNVKSRSSGWVHRTFPGLGEFAWQDGYAVFSVSRSQAARVERYIHDQEEHHRKRDFKAELVALLEAHGVEYDPRYLF